MYETDHDDQDEISKSQRKRDVQELKKLGVELLDFSDDALRQLMLPDVLLDALRTAKNIHTDTDSILVKVRPPAGLTGRHPHHSGLRDIIINDHSDIGHAVRKYMLEHFVRIYAVLDQHLVPHPKRADAEDDVGHMLLHLRGAVQPPGSTDPSCAQ